MHRLWIAFTLALVATSNAPCQAAEGPHYTNQGELTRPEGYREWVFIGSSLTPNGLNGGKTAFPEFHNVYISAQNLAGYRKTGKFPEGTVLVKELTSIGQSTHDDGSANLPSGRGYTQGSFTGLAVMVKDSKKFADTKGWGFFEFGAFPYKPSAKVHPAADCASCHAAGAARTDMTWVQFYPILRAKYSEK